MDGAKLLVGFSILDEPSRLVSVKDRTGVLARKVIHGALSHLHGR